MKEGNESSKSLFLSIAETQEQSVLLPYNALLRYNAQQIA